jgi:hypothetical protein
MMRYFGLHGYCMVGDDMLILNYLFSTPMDRNTDRAPTDTKFWGNSQKFSAGLHYFLVAPAVIGPLPQVAEGSPPQAMDATAG